MGLYANRWAEAKVSPDTLMQLTCDVIKTKPIGWKNLMAVAVGDGKPIGAANDEYLTPRPGLFKLLLAEGADVAKFRTTIFKRAANGNMDWLTTSAEHGLLTKDRAKDWQNAVGILESPSKVFLTEYVKRVQHMTDTFSESEVHEAVTGISKLTTAKNAIPRVLGLLVRSVELTAPVNSLELESEIELG